MSANDSSARLDADLLRTGGILILGAIMALLDTTIVNVGIDTLAHDFTAPLPLIQWVSTGYLLAAAVGMPISGWAVDRFGGRTVWLAATALFMLGSLGGGLAFSAGSLIMFRILQGLSGGMIEPVTQTMLAKAAGPRRVGRVMGLMAVPLMLAPTVGPLVGGLIIDHLSWRWMFLINIPIGLAALLLALRYVPRDRPETTSAGKLDVRGLLLLGPGFATLVYALSQVGEARSITSAPTLTALGLAIVLLAAYADHALRAKARALIDLRLFSSPGFSATAAIMFLIGIVFFGAMFLLPLYYQQARDASPLAAGLLLAPQGLGGMLGMPIAGRLADRFSARRIVPAGLGLIMIGTIAYTQLGPHSNELWLACWLFVRGIGLSAAVAPTLASVYRTVIPEAAARATTVTYILNQIGGAVGIAAAAVILNTATSRHTPSDGAFASAFWWMQGFTMIALLVAFLLPRTGTNTTGHSEDHLSAPEGST